MNAKTAVAITTGMVREGENAVVARRATVRSATSTHRTLIQSFVFLMLQLPSSSDVRLEREGSNVAAYSGDLRPPSIGGRWRRMLTIWIDIVNNIRQNGRP